jgi:hypothetical protein
MGSGAKIHIQTFMKLGLGIQKFIGGYRTHRENGDLIILLLFLQNKESRLKVKLFPK